MKVRYFAIALAVVAFCAVHARAMADCDAAATASTVLFVTDREPLADNALFSGQRGKTPDRHPIITYGVLGAPVAKASETLCSSKGAFYRAVRRQFAPGQPRAALLYIHGYYTSFATAAQDALTLKRALHFPGPVILYSWPSKVTSRFAYMDDESNYQWSLSHFNDLVTDLVTEFPSLPLSFAAHSLGARFATAGMRFIRHSACPKCFGHAIFFAPDVDSDTLFDELTDMQLCNGRPLTTPTAAATVTLYVSNRDTALRDSQQIHGHQRAGQAGSEMILCRDVDTIDVSYYKGHDPAGHSYQTDPPVLRDAAAAFAGISPVSPKRALNRADRPGGQYYELKP